METEIDIRDYINNYNISASWSDEDECYVASCLEFPFIMSHGDTRSEAIDEIEDALNQVLAILFEEGKELPQPYSKREY
jgi:predicted RNase H-like HicB family nuclease